MCCKGCKKKEVHSAVLHTIRHHISGSVFVGDEPPGFQLRLQKGSNYKDILMIDETCMYVAVEKDSLYTMQNLQKLQISIVYRSTTS